MRVSIVTISYNQAQFLERTLLSVIEQDSCELEYIVVDPGSTDGSREIIQKHADRINRIIFEPDDGPASGLNKGFRAATGEVLGFINSDDFLLPGAVQIITAQFLRHPDADVISGHAIVVDDEERIVRKTYSDVFSLRRFIYGACILLQPSTFFRKGIYENTGGFNNNNRLSWDAELFYKMGLGEARFMRINSFLSAIRVHDSSITSKMMEGASFNNEGLSTLSFIGRERKGYDYFAFYLYLLIRYLTNPLDVYERIRHGPIYGRPLK